MNLEPPFDRATLDEFAESLETWSHPSLDPEDMLGDAAYTEIFLATLGSGNYSVKVKGICVDALCNIIRDENRQIGQGENGQDYDRADLDRAIAGCRKLKGIFLADEEYISEELRSLVYPLIGLTYRPLEGKGKKKRAVDDSRPLSDGETLGCGVGCLTALLAMFFLVRK